MSRSPALLQRHRRREPISAIAYDTFTRADSTTTLGTAESGQAWTPATGAVWGISSNQAYWVSGTAVIATLNAGVPDGTITVRIPVLGSEPGLYFRTTDGNNNWRCVLSAGALVLQKIVSGTRTTSANPAVTFNAGDTMGVRCAGSTITTLINGTVISTVTDSQWASVTNHGIGFGTANTAARFDDFKVTVP